MTFWFFHLLLLFYISYVGATVFTLKNNCRNPVWPGIQPGGGKPVLKNGGFQLKPGQTVRISAPKGWSGRFWGRYGCTFDKNGHGTCVTGDCGGLLGCAGGGGTPPATLAEFTLDSPVDYYDVSLVDGYNIPVSVFPAGGSGTCRPARCVSDLNMKCPWELQVRRKGKVVACKSACMAFNTPRYCCTGAYGSPDTCEPTHYSRVFKQACPSAYSYAYDDRTSILTCKCTWADYLIRFC
ncbi:pathogenesis-related thaumatin-like protein 3.5 [Tasmannia lanceolata]|uniref:pathogenesis-related thaumatin-like protein 3.5 n=1 Tax=Tasmannia lanceolata TaxID=3420 RepID=UPI0040640977